MNDDTKRTTANLRIYNEAAKPYEIIINWIKTVILSNKTNEFILNDIPSNVEIKQEAKLLGLMMRYDGKACNAVADRISKATNAFNALKKLFRNTLIETKIRLRTLDAMIKPMMIYALHTQDLEKTHFNKIQQKYSNFVRFIHEAEERIEAWRDGTHNTTHRDNNEKIRKNGIFARYSPC